MAWETEMVTVLRHMVADFATPYRYSDERLHSLILTGAQLIQSDFVFATTYTIDFTNTDISPDPTTPTRDDTFINLTLMKAACIIDNCEARLGGRKSVRMQDGDKEIDARNVGEHLIKIWEKGWCKTLKETMFNLQCGDGSMGMAVMGPFREFSGAWSTTWSPEDNSIFEGRYR